MLIGEREGEGLLKRKFRDRQRDKVKEREMLDREEKREEEVQYQ